MDPGIWLEYAWVFLIICGLEGLLGADNALVMGVLVEDLSEKKRKKALFYGIFGAYCFRIIAVFLVSFIAGIWQVQAIGAVYLIYLGVKNFVQKKQEDSQKTSSRSLDQNESLWKVILKVELTDLAFAIDSVLAAVAIAVSLPDSPLPAFGGMDGGKMIVVIGGMCVGLAFIRFAAHTVVRYMQKYPALEKAAFIVVAWVGVKLAIHVLSHPQINFGFIPPHFTHNVWWKVFFWGIMLLIIVGTWLYSARLKSKQES